MFVENLLTLKQTIVKCINVILGLFQCKRLSYLFRYSCYEDTTLLRPFQWHMDCANSDVLTMGFLQSGTNPLILSLQLESLHTKTILILKLDPVITLIPTVLFDLILLLSYIRHDVCHSNIRTDSRFAPSQWETTLLCNNVSHWLGASLDLALQYHNYADFSYRSVAQVYTTSSFLIDTLRLRQNGHHFADDPFEMHFLEWKCMNFDCNFIGFCS